jgi:lipid-binding SYLF domain-containing protein
MVKAGKPINKLTNKLGSEAFWPSTLEEECNKCARILKSFTARKDDGEHVTSTPIQTAPSNPSATGPAKQSKAVVKIPPKVLQSAKGLAIFTTFRTGLHISGAGGSGIVMSRLPNGDWSPPSAFLVHTLGYGLMAGADIYDCVCVLNTVDAVVAFTHPRLSLGGEIAVVAGPIGAGGSVEGAVGKGMKPVYSYMKSRGLYGGLQADGTVILQRPDANAAFYGRKVAVKQILNGEVQWPPASVQLREVARDAEGKSADETVVQSIPSQTPGDLSPEFNEKKT